MRYRLHKITLKLHDTSSGCDDTRGPNLRPLDYEGFRVALNQGADPCNHCFRDDAAAKPDPTDIMLALVAGIESGIFDEALETAVARAEAWLGVSDPVITDEAPEPVIDGFEDESLSPDAEAGEETDAGETTESGEADDDEATGEDGDEDDEDEKTVKETPKKRRR